VFGNSKYNTKVYIMSPAIMDLDLDPETMTGSAMAATLNQGSNIPLYGTRLDSITMYLDQLLPNVPVEKFIYRRQKGDNLLQNGAYGAGMVLYSNDQTVDPSTLDDLNPHQAIWQCWMQGQIMGSDQWDPLPG
jgi:hypothetical protein